MKIRRGIKKWGGNGDMAGTSHEWCVEVDHSDDLHINLRPGHEVEDMMLALQLVDQLLVSYVIRDMRPGELSVVTGPYTPEPGGASYDPELDRSRR